MALAKWRKNSWRWAIVSELSSRWKWHNNERRDKKSRTVRRRTRYLNGRASIKDSYRSKTSRLGGVTAAA